MTFKLFEVGIRKGEEKITITRSKYLRFSPAFILENNLNDKRYIRIYIDEKEHEKLIGFEFLNEQKEKSLKLSKSEKSKGAYCSGSSLFTELKLKREEMEKSIDFKPSKKDFEGKKLFVIKVPKNNYQ